MLRISKITDYGIVLTTRLGSGPLTEPRAVRDLAAETRIPQPTASKVLKSLTRAGIVESVRGAHGGYRLARAPEDIGIDEVITALEGPIAVTECTSDDEAALCDYEGQCGVQANWQRINVAVQSALASITVADMVHATPNALVQVARSAEEAAQRRAGERVANVEAQGQQREAGDSMRDVRDSR